MSEERKFKEGMLAIICMCSSLKCEVCGAGGVMCGGCGKVLCVKHGHFEELLEPPPEEQD